MTDVLTENTTFVLIVIPVLVALLRAAFSDEISYWMGVLSCYFYRPFDVDKNPATHDWCYLYNPGNGEWSLVSLTFHFSCFRGRNGVYVHRYDKDWNLEMIQRIPFANWREMLGRAKVVRADIPESVLVEVSRYGAH